MIKNLLLSFCVVAVIAAPVAAVIGEESVEDVAEKRQAFAIAGAFVNVQQHLELLGPLPKPGLSAGRRVAKVAVRPFREIKSLAIALEHPVGVRRHERVGRPAPNGTQQAKQQQTYVRITHYRQTDEPGC